MRNAMLADLAGLDGVRVTCAVPGAADADIPSTVQVSCRPGGRPPHDYLREQARANDLVWVVAPETGGLLASLRRVVADRQWLGCSREAIDVAGSKQATVLCLRAAGVATPRGIGSGDPVLAGPETGGWVVKPDDGCGAAGIRRHADLAGALADRAGRRRRQERAVVERWVDGEPLSITLLCSAGGAEVLSLNRQRIEADESGGVCFAGVEIGSVPADRRERLGALASRVQRAIPGLAGIVGVDLVWHPVRGPVVIEVNPRPTCAYEGLSAMLRRNLAAEMMALHGQDWPGTVPATVAAAA